MSEANHPVWSVYDRLRSASLSVKYYSCRLEQLERLNFWLDFVLLATAPTSAIAGLWFWSSDVGQLAWKWAAMPAAVAAVLKPMLHLVKRIKDYEGVLSGYRMLDFDLRELKLNIEQRRKFDAPLQAEFKRVQQRERTLVGKNPESKESRRIKLVCQNQVNKELPSEAFFLPQE